jgi:serine/threonine-protein kinase HipA
LGGSHILKPPSSEYPGMPELEHWTMRLAGCCGITVAEAGLIPLASGEMSFVVRRFDRLKGRRIAVEDLCQLLEQPTTDKYRASLEKVGTVIRRHATTPGRDALSFFDRVVFCFLTGNSDMHLKNWSLLCDGGRIELSPAYDLLPTRLLLADPEESALPLNGRKAKLTPRDFLALAAHLKVPEKVARQRMATIPPDLARAIDAIPSPWVAAQQAQAFRSHVQEMTVRLSM